MSFQQIKIKNTVNKNGSARKTRLGNGVTLTWTMPLAVSTEMRSYIEQKSALLGVNHSDYVRSLLFKEMMLEDCSKLISTHIVGT